MGSSKQKIFASTLTTLGVLGPVAAAIIQLGEGIGKFRTPGTTSYSPYSSVGMVEHQITFVGIGFLVVLLVANLVVARGLRAMPRAKIGLPFGLLVPVALELAGFLPGLLSLMSSTSDTPRRYHYYYFAPSPASPLQTAWDLFVPNAVWPVFTHAACLVLVVLGHVFATQNAEAD